MSNNYSALFYLNLQDKAEMLRLPTIQSLSIPDNSTIPSKPTITNEWRNQYVVAEATRVTIVLWLENGKFGEETVDVSETLDKLVYLKKNRIKFNLTTTQTGEESRFLVDLVIENLSTNRESSHRNRLICTINCRQIKLIDLTWKQASAIEIFGHDIFTNAEDEIQVLNTEFIAGNTDTDFELSDNAVSSLITKLGDISGYSDMPVTRHIRAAIQDKVTLDTESAYYKLTDPIDLSVGNQTCNCSCKFTSRYGLGSDDKSYTVDLGKFVVQITKKDASIVENFPITLGYKLAAASSIWFPARASRRISQIKRNTESISAYPYDCADTYSNFTVSKTMEYIESTDKLATFLKESEDSGLFTEDLNAISSGGVVVKNDCVWSYKIKDRYQFSVNYNSVTKSFTPDGALKIETVKLKKSDFKLTISNVAKQQLWDDLNYDLSLVVVMLGAMVQLYLFSPVLFNRNRVVASG